MIQYAGLWLPDGETHLIPHLAKGPQIDGKGTYQFAKLEIALLYVTQFRVAVDIGAHVGLWSRVLAPDFLQVEAFEPKQAHRECFELNVNAENVRLHHCALGARPGEVEFETEPGHSMKTYIVPDGDGRSVAPMRTLDSYGFDDVDFIKIDTEGYELEVLRGAVETLRRCKPVLIVEQKANNGSRYGYDDRAALPFLHALGARVVEERARDYVLVWR